MWVDKYISIFESVLNRNNFLCNSISMICPHINLLSSVPSLISRAHPAIVAICYLKCRVATNISHKLKVKSRWFKNYIFAKKCIMISFWIFEYCFFFFLFLHTLLLCHILLFDCWIFSIPSGWKKKKIGSRSGSKLFAKVISRHSGQRVKYKTTCWYFLAKTVAKVNFIWLQLFPFG